MVENDFVGLSIAAQPLGLALQDPQAPPHRAAVESYSTNRQWARRGSPLSRLACQWASKSRSQWATLGRGCLDLVGQEQRERLGIDGVRGRIARVTRPDGRDSSQ